jgi:hypothetical protein
MIVNTWGAMSDAYARIWKEAVMVYFKAISHHFLKDQDDDDDDDNNVMIAVSRQILEPSTPKTIEQAVTAAMPSTNTWEVIA